MDPIIILIISIINFFAAFFGVSVGGSGLVMTPVLLSFGVPAPSAIATKRVSNLGMSSFSLLKFHKEKKVIWRVGLPLIIVSIISSFIAANIVLTIGAVILQRIIGIVIIGTIIFTLANKSLGIEERVLKTRKRNKILGAFFFFLAIFIAHISGGGSGIFTSHVLIVFFGLTFLQAAGTRKIAGLVGTIVAASIYIISGIVPFELALPMLIAGVLGGWLGTHYAIMKGDVWVRRLFLIVLTILGARMLVF
jgi:uncharacterized membrane protein YfcA